MGGGEGKEEVTMGGGVSAELLLKDVEEETAGVGVVMPILK